MKKLGLRTKVLAAGLLTLAVPIMVIGIISVRQSVQSIDELARNRMVNTARSLAGGLDIILQEQIAKIRNISYFDSVITAAEKTAVEGEKSSRNEIFLVQKELTKIKNAEGNRLSSILLVGKNGIAFAASDNGKLRGLDLSGRAYLDLAFKGTPNIGSVVISRASGRVVCTAACPIYASAGKEITGAVVMGMELHFFTKIVDEIRTGKSGYASLVGKSGLYITHPVKENILKTNISKIKGMESMLVKSGRGEEGMVEYDLDGIRKFAAFAPIPVTGWTVVNTIPADELHAPANFTRNVIISVSILFFVLVSIFFFFFARNLTRPLIQLTEASKKIAAGDLDVEVGGGIRQDEIGILARAFNEMTAGLGKARKESERNDWLKTGVAQLNEALRGDPDMGTLSAKVIAEITKYIGAQVGVLYVADNGNQPSLSLMGSYAYTKRKNLSNVFAPGEGLVGQAALEKQQILVKNVPEDYIRVTSGLGELVPRFICVTPFIYDDHVKGVVELGTLNEISEREMEYLSQVMPTLAVAVESAHRRTQLAAALEESQKFSEELQVQQEDLKAANEELQVQQEELKTANEELEEQTKRLKESEERLKTQQEELQVTNEELEEKNELLDRQKREVEAAQRQVQEKAEEVALASKYKSEFLANMSHELRTPLNSLLLLAQGLAQNKEDNLTTDQVESAKVIYDSGSDLLNLINEILDLSKIEAGRMDLQMSAVSVVEIADDVRATFIHVAGEKGLTFEVEVRPEAPAELTTDLKRVEQVIRNLVSNAIKFTEAGSVTIVFGRPAASEDLFGGRLDPSQTLSIAVRDTGIGIAPEDRKRIFEAFQQADGGTARKYGGTGLGLSISRQLAQLLGGEIQLESEQGKGSVFTFYVPVHAETGRRDERQGHKKGAGRIPREEVLRKVRGTEGTTGNERTDPGSDMQIPNYIPDDRESISKGDRIVLVIEDDPKFAKVLLDTCHKRGFKCLAAPTGEKGLDLATRYVPDGVILDIRMPGMDGWTVLGALKDNIRTRHIPVHVISVEEATTESLRKGAIGHTTKPISHEELDLAFKRLEQISAEKKKRVLLVEDDEKMRGSVKRLIGDKDVEVDEAATGQQALDAMRTKRYGCLVLDLGLPDISGAELLSRIEREGIELPPVIVHTSRDLTEQEEMDIREHAESIVIKDVRSQERLLDEVSLFLHRMVGKMPETKKQMIRNLHETDALLKDKKVLIVDDDMRTTFALSRLLVERGMNPLKAGNGEQALLALQREPDVDLVLMDIMMPKMDGYEAIKRIRAQDRFRKLPIIALTAKAMPEDRMKCIEAGADDYLPKPMDQERLISMMRVWLYR